MAPTVCDAVGRHRACSTPATSTIADRLPTPATVREWAGEEHGFRFKVQRELVETVVARTAVDWSELAVPVVPVHGLARGPVQRVRLQLLQVARRSSACGAPRPRPCASSTPTDRMAERGHRARRLRSCSGAARTARPTSACSARSSGDGDELVCTLHGWRFDLETGRCLQRRRPPPAGPPRHAGLSAEVQRPGAAAASWTVTVSVFDATPPAGVVAT